LAKKIPQIIKEIRQFTPLEIDYSYQKSISYSQFSIWKQCPHRWELMYKDGHSAYTPTIHTVFGTAIHETLQHYLTVMYEESGAAADRINIEEYFEERFRENYAKGYKDNKNVAQHCDSHNKKALNRKSDWGLLLLRSKGSHAL
jgi:hypothetical protein